MRSIDPGPDRAGAELGDLLEVVEDDHDLASVSDRRPNPGDGLHLGARGEERHVQPEGDGLHEVICAAGLGQIDEEQLLLAAAPAGPFLGGGGLADASWAEQGDQPATGGEGGVDGGELSAAAKEASPGPRRPPCARLTSAERGCGCQRSWWLLGVLRRSSGRAPPA